MSPLIAIENAYATALGRLNSAFDKAPGTATATAAGIVGGAGYLGWKTWESGIGDTIKSVLRLPESAGRGLMEGVRDGTAQAHAEAGQTGAVRAATAAGEAPAVQGLASVGEAASTAAGKLSAVSTDLGTLGMLIAWASKSDIGFRHPPTDEQLAAARANPSPLFRLPGDPDTPASATEPVSAVVPARATEPAPSLVTAPAEPAAPSLVPAMHELTEALREQARRSADEFRRDPEAARGRAMMENSGGIQAVIAAHVAAAAAATPQPVTTAAQAPQNVTNNQQKYVTAPISVSAPITINATLNNTTPGAIANTVAAGIHQGVRAGSAALHDGTETK